MGSYLLGRDVHVPAEIPRAALVVSTLLSMVTIAVLAVCLGGLRRHCNIENSLLIMEIARRIQATSHWGRVPITRWCEYSACLMQRTAADQPHSAVRDIHRFDDVSYRHKCP